MGADEVKRILFFVNDFKTEGWAIKLKKFKYEVVLNEHRFLSHIKIIVNGLIRNQKIHAFVFRYLNDHKSLYESNLYLFRDAIILLLCKILRVKVLWILHNIDRETQVFHPFLIFLRRKMIYFFSKRVLVTDPHLVKIAQNYGIKEQKIEWLCFGKPRREAPDKKNIDLKRKITAFRKKLNNNEGRNICLGLCVSKPAKKKLHYLLGDSIVGMPPEDKDSIVGLILIGKFPDGQYFDNAKRRVKKSPHILYIEDSFEVNEFLISDQIDFFYRSLSDQSVPYTLYVAANVRKPMITHNVGALPFLINKENLGFTVGMNEEEIPIKILEYVDSWSPEGADQFLKNRTWEIAAKQLIRAIED